VTSGPSSAGHIEDRKLLTPVMTSAREQLQPRANVIIEAEKPTELPLQKCLDGVGISLLSEWDVLIFVYRHGASLTTVDQIARLIGYPSGIVSDTLDRLEREELIERSRPSRGVRFYRILTSMDSRRWPYLRQLIRLSESRAGRLQLAERLKAPLSDSGRKERAS
jgi:DNA-binding MarR family transcriptional regulator